MNWRKCLLKLSAISIFLGLTTLEAQAALRVKALPIGARGVVEDLKPNEWKVKIGGKDGKLISMRTPSELGKERQNWVFVFLPIREPEIRQMVVHAVATFMTTLPATDSVLIVVRTGKGLECFTPGFTTRPSLWERALARTFEELPARLPGNPEPAFSLPPSPVSEKEESMEPVLAFLAKLPSMNSDLKTDDMSTRRESILDSYSIESLPGYAKTVTLAMASLEQLGEVLARDPGEKNLVILSRNEIDDLANPAWGRKVSQMTSGGMGARGRNEIMGGRDILNNKLQTEMMIRDVTLARISLSEKLARLGLTLHSVGGAGASYTGAFGEAAQASGGFQFRFEMDLASRLSQLLPLWAARYELELVIPADTPKPTKLSIDTTRKDLRVYAPSAH